MTSRFVHRHRHGKIMGQLRKLKALHEKTPGVRNPCSFRTVYCTQAVCVWSKGDHGSVQGWDDYWTHAGDVGVVTTTLWCRQLAQQSGGAQLLRLVDHQLVQYFGPELVMGHFLKTQPNPKFLDPTQPTKVFTRPNPTHHRHLVWHNRL